MSDGRHAEIFVWVCIAFFSGLFCLNLIPGSWAGEGGAPVAGAMEDALQSQWEAAAELRVWADRDLPGDARFIEAIVEVESGGAPDSIGPAGERGLMQIREGTWNEVTRDLFSKPLSFDSAFDPKLNRQVGTAYLVYLQEYLRGHRDAWHGQRFHVMLAACYNAGPTSVSRAGFNLANLPSVTQSYAGRVATLYEYFLQTDPL